MVALNPAPSSLGLASPALGPWFSDASLQIPVPGTDLAAAMSIPAGVRWLAPAGGTLGFLVASAARPRGLAHLRQASGGPAFTDGQLVALFRLLPEVEERLYKLSSAIPSPDGTTPAPAAATRSRVRYLAVEFTTALTISDLAAMIKPDLSGTDAEKADAVGLAWNGSALSNAAAPVSILRKPDPSGSDPAKALLNFPGGSATNIKLWAFDAGGRAIDPGAVAAWWSYLATTAYTGLWADSSVTRTAPGAAQLTLHLTNAHEGPLSAVLAGRLNLTNITGTDPVRVMNTNAQFAFTAAPAAPAPDDAPQPRLAMLPHGTYGSSLTLFASGPVHASLARDFVRVAILDVEEHLVGQKRLTSGGSPTADETRRAADQNRASTRVNVAQSLAPALLATTDAATDAVVNVLTGTAGGAQLVTDVLERDWAGLDPLTALPMVAPPNPLPAPTVTALTGGGTASGGTVSNQKVLVEFALDVSLAGAWVRAWPQGFEPTTGRHFYMDGGGGRVRADGHVNLVLPLIDGDVNPPAPMGMEVLVVTGSGSQIYGDVRFTRPAPAGGSPIALGAVVGNVLICETGDFQAAGALANVPSGAAVVTHPSPSALVDKSTIPTAAFTADAVGRALAAGDKLQLTPPAFKNEPAGDSTATLGATGATVAQQGRNGLLLASNPGDPLPTLERLEVVAAGVDSGGTGAARAAIATTPSLSRYHELPSHQAGHPGAPAAVEVHGTGVALTGPAGLLAAEYTRERTAGFTPQLAIAAATPFPSVAVPAGAHIWAAVLRTVASGVEMEINASLLSALLNTSSTYPWGDTALTQLNTWLAGFGITLPGGLAGDLASVARAIDRRMMVGSRGAREGATSLVAAINRAEDFLYIETPAIDDQPFGKSGDQLNLWGALKQRMTDRPALQVLICLPTEQMPGLPKPMGKVRVELARQALASLRAAGPASAPGVDRLAVFCPQAGPGRTIRLSATTVIVDDAYCLTGTTHLWRRGLSFDSSLAAAVFDETLSDGRPKEIRQFRRTLLADRLGLAANEVPADPTELVASVRKLVARGGGIRLSSAALEAPVPVPSAEEKLAWNPDGSPLSASNPIDWITSAISAIIAAELP